MAIDRSMIGAKRQLEAMACERYEVGIREASTGRTMNKTWSREEVLNSLSWLKHENATGADIYVRPAREERHGLVLVDDLTTESLKAMEQDGIEPAAVVRTSQANYQAWIRLGDDVPAELRRIVARKLAMTYHGDPASADSHHYGRLAGLTNRKRERMTPEGFQPWVVCESWSGTPCSKAAELLREAEAEKQKQAQTSPAVEVSAPHDDAEVETIGTHRRTAPEEYRSEMAGLRKRFTDLSQCDFIACKKLAERGWGTKDIAQAMIEQSPNLAKRKAGHVAEYVQLTINKVMKLPQVIEARARLLGQDKEIGL